MESHLRLLLLLDNYAIDAKFVCKILWILNPVATCTEWYLYTHYVHVQSVAWIMFIIFQKSIKLWKSISWNLRAYCTPGPYFWRLNVFSQIIKQLRTKYPMDLIRMFQGTQKSQLYFCNDHGCEVTINNVWKSIFSMFWSINQ